jgi:hypothetical protein
MSKVKRPATLSGLIDSDVEEAMFNELPTPDSAVENRGAAKKVVRGRPKAAPTKVTKAKAPARRISGRLTAKDNSKDVVSKGKRKALADKTNQQYDEETEDVDDFEQDLVMEGTEVEDIAPTKQAKAKAVKNAVASRGKAANATARTSIGDSQGVPEPALRGMKKGRPATKEIAEDSSLEKVIQETQQDAMDMDGDDEEIEDFVLKTALNRQTSYPRPRQQPIQRLRAGSASDTERGDPNLRRKLGEMTKKYENLQLKHQDLREIGLKEYERNYEKLRKQNEDKTRGENR